MNARVFECIDTGEGDSVGKFDGPFTSDTYLDTFEVKLCTSKSVLAPHGVSFMQGN